MMYPTLLHGHRARVWLAGTGWLGRAGGQRGKRIRGQSPVKTVPAHHAEVRQANEADVAQIFGGEGDGMFVVGHTIEQGYPVRLDLKKFVQAQQRHFWGDGHGQELPDAHGAGRADAGRRRRRAGVRHAQRIRLRRHWTPTAWSTVRGSARAVWQQQGAGGGAGQRGPGARQIALTSRWKLP